VRTRTASTAFVKEEVDVAVQIKKAKKATIGAEALGEVIARAKAVEIEHVAIGAVHPNPRNNKKHPARQIALLVENIVELGLTTPIIVDENGMILAGHGRHLAAQKLKLPEIPAIRLSHLTEAQKRVLAISDNRISELGRWDLDRLAIELGELSNPALEVNLDIALTGFDTVEIDEILMPTIGRRPAGASELTARSASGPVITRLGDIWVCGDHILACGGPLDAAPYEKIFAGERATAAIGRAPCEELGAEARAEVFKIVCERIGAHVSSGAVIYYFVPWDQFGELCEIAEPYFGRPRDLMVWADPKPQHGGYYRSCHGLVALYVAGNGPPLRHDQLSKRGRHRPSVWHYCDGTGAQPPAPGVKPVALVIDILRDCSRPGDIILDPFARSGATLIAAERLGRRARLIERDPAWCDLILRQYQELSDLPPRLAGGTDTFPQIVERRLKDME